MEYTEYNFVKLIQGIRVKENNSCVFFPTHGQVESNFTFFIITYSSYKNFCNKYALFYKNEESYFLRQIKIFHNQTLEFSKYANIQASFLNYSSIQVTQGRNVQLQKCLNKRCASEIYRNTTSKLIKATYMDLILKFSNVEE